MIGHDEIADTIASYLQRYPDERERLGLLRDTLDTCDDITARSTLPGHVTCSAILIDPDRRVLHIRHNALNRWLRPGGHLESSDVTLINAALREVEEETGIPATVPVALDKNPLDIDVHHIPANPAKGEPEHWHFDLRYGFTITRVMDTRLQIEEVSDIQWIPIEDIESGCVRDRTLAAQGG